MSQKNKYRSSSSLIRWWVSASQIAFVHKQLGTTKRISWFKWKGWCSISKCNHSPLIGVSWLSNGNKTQASFYAISVPAATFWDGSYGVWWFSLTTATRLKTLATYLNFFQPTSQSIPQSASRFNRSVTIKPASMALLNTGETPPRNHNRKRPQGADSFCLLNTDFVFCSVSIWVTICINRFSNARITHLIHLSFADLWDWLLTKCP